MLTLLMGRVLLGLAITGAIAYVVICTFLWLRQTHFIFFPSPHLEQTPAAFNLPYEDVWLRIPSSSAGSTERPAAFLHGWWIPATPPATGVLLYLHGNGLNIGANLSQASRFHQVGLSVLLVDYRGYGHSSGPFPTEAQVYQDAEVAWNYLTQERHINPSNIFIYGHSLGGAIAIDLAQRHPKTAGLIIQSSFTSMRAVIRQVGHYELFPIDLLLTQKFNSLEKVTTLNMLVLYLHGTADRQVPAFMSQQLFAATPEPKQLRLVENAGHNDVAEVAGPSYRRILQTFITQARARQGQVVQP